MNTGSKALLGRIGVFLLPSLKMKSLSPRGRTYDQELHDFLLQNFTGYTVTTGNISGYWISCGHEHYGEHREYKVAFSDPSKVPSLERYVAVLAAEIGEQTVYWEIGDEAYLLAAAPSQ
jgi:hypothetical protein